MGWLARQFGLACDNVARFEVVSANGEILHASQSQNPDLFRGLRGGGGNFGIVTEFGLHPADTADLFYRPDRRASGAAPMARPEHWRAAPGNADRPGLAPPATGRSCREPRAGGSGPCCRARATASARLVAPNLSRRWLTCF